jgi:hypothetical protein
MRCKEAQLDARGNQYVPFRRTLAIRVENDASNYLHAKSFEMQEKTVSLAKWEIAYITDDNFTNYVLVFKKEWQDCNLSKCIGMHQ